MTDKNPAPSGETPSLPPTWVGSDRPVPRVFVQPVLRFMRLEASGGVVMLIAAVIAIAWANSPWSASYFNLFETTIHLEFGDFHFHHLSELTVQEWINDALMVIFFFVVGLEIKRELVVGELRDPRAAALPAIAAIGGMVLPAALYAWLNAGGPGSDGWGIPMATDIAFAIGVVAMMGSRVPVSAKLFLLALAIVDDLGAILVIALFYTSELSIPWLLTGAGGLGLMWVLRKVNVRSLWVYVGLGAFIWLAILESGVHATVAGVAIALLTPVTPFLDPQKFAARARVMVDRIDAYVPDDDPLELSDHHTLERVQKEMADLRTLTAESIPPLMRHEYALNPYSSYVVVPLFALANAGVVISLDSVGGFLTDNVAMGVFLGLVVGKVVGVTAAAWIAVRLGIGRLPTHTTWRHMIGIGFLSGIGFTVALFVSALSFESGSALADSAKIGIFAASIVAGVAGYAWLRGGPDVRESA
ncbi:MAG: Na+/H+ antiporter NhaA [Nitriliruptorales bacterium]|nr:Na+/H+ antiporter NhaA [Nitriliruptorales bacterium]